MKNIACLYCRNQKIRRALLNTFTFTACFLKRNFCDLLYMLLQDLCISLYACKFFQKDFILKHISIFMLQTWLFSLLGWNTWLQQPESGSISFDLWFQRAHSMVTWPPMFRQNMTWWYYVGVDSCSLHSWWEEDCNTWEDQRQATLNTHPKRPNS